jgi:uncharacterized membrane protein
MDHMWTDRIRFWGMQMFLKGLVFIGVWVVCTLLGLVIPYLSDPRHDVEWAIATMIGMGVGAILGPIVGHWMTKLAFRTR